MFQIEVGNDGWVRWSGRLDASEADRALENMEQIDGPLTLDCRDLEYISSAGLGVVVRIFKRLRSTGHSLRLVHLQPRVRNVFSYAGLDRILQIE